MTEECKRRFLMLLEKTRGKPEKILINEEDSVSKILQLAYCSFIDQRGDLSLNGEEYKEVVKKAVEICDEAKMPVIRGELVPFSITSPTIKLLELETKH